MPKTSVVEKALSQYLMQFEALMDKKKKDKKIRQKSEKYQN